MSIIRNGLLSADLDVPVVIPTLNLDFANSQSLDKRITFTRGSIGTFVNKNGLIETAQVNQPRFDYDPISGECRGLLIEESRQNLLTYSDIEGTVGTQPTNMYFAISSGQSALVSTDVSLGPNGKSCKHIRGVGGDNNIGYMGTSSATAGSTYVFSTYVYIPSSLAKNFSGKYITFQMEQPGTFVSAFADVTIVDRWQRVFGTCVPSTTAVSWILRTNAVAGSFLYTDCWQLEQGAFPTSYIPTTASTVTRSVDNAEMIGTNFSSWYNQSEGTFFYNGTLPFITNDTVNRVPYGVSNGFSFANSMYVVKGNTSLGLSFNAINNNLNVSPFTSLPNMTSSKIKIASSVAPNNFYSCGYGGVVNKHSRTSAAIPPATRLTLGKEPWNASPINPIIGCINKFAYYPKALSPAQLQTLTS
jgi:hypothetical protein